mgnify:FL=1
MAGFDVAGRSQIVPYGEEVPGDEDGFGEGFARPENTGLSDGGG